MSKAITSKIDKNGFRYYPVTLFESRGRITVNNRSFCLSVNQLETFTAFQRSTLYAEVDHPHRPDEMSNEEYTSRYNAIDIKNVAGILKLFPIYGKGSNSVVLNAHYYPATTLPAEMLELFEQGAVKLGIRARVDSGGNICDIITWDLVTAEPEANYGQKRKVPRPPERTTVLVSSNQGHTWFPAQFLWLGRKTFVWRNMLPGANEGNEIPEKSHYSYFMWKPIPKGWAERTYHPHNETEEIRQYLRS